MFEDYLQDAEAFLVQARKVEDDRIAQRYYRASVFYAASAMEAFINCVSIYFAEAMKSSPQIKLLTCHDIAFLNDKNIEYSYKRFKMEEKIVYHTLEDKIKLLFKRFKPEQDHGTTVWASLLEFKKFRDDLVHPKKIDDNISRNDYDKRICTGLKSVIETMNSLSLAIYKRPLRKQLLDLIPS